MGLSAALPGRSGATAPVTALIARLTKLVPAFLAAAVFLLADFTAARAVFFTDLMPAPAFLATFLLAALLAMAFRFAGCFALLAIICSSIGR